MIYAITGTVLAVIATFFLVALIKTSASSSEKTFDTILCLLAWANAIALWFITLKGDGFTEETKLYLRQYAPTKRLICFMHEAFENSTSETEKRQIANIILEKERLVDEIYNLVFQLPNSTELVLLDLRYLNNMTVEEVCSTLYISKSTYFKHHKNALKLLAEMRNKN
jgi:hypothetical protein